MLVETSSSGKITVSGNPYIFRISPTSEMEAKAFTPLFKSMGIKKAGLPGHHNDFGLGASKEFSEARKREGVQVGVMETMDPEGHRLLGAARQDQGLGRRHAVRDDAVEQITLILKQAKDQQLGARIITTAAPTRPTADPAGGRGGERLAASGVLHAVVHRCREEPRRRQQVRGRWNEKTYPVGGLTEGFRGWDGIHVIVEAIKAAGKPEPRPSPRRSGASR
jgi:branched-chain amino acid transport system substrate-binding protein